MKRRVAPISTLCLTNNLKIKSKQRRDDVEVHCHFRMLELKDIPITECIKCSKWFHVGLRLRSVPKQAVINYMTLKPIEGVLSSLQVAIASVLFSSVVVLIS